MIELNYEAAKEQALDGARRDAGTDIGGEVAFCAGSLYGSHPEISSGDAP